MRLASLTRIPEITTNILSIKMYSYCINETIFFIKEIAPEIRMREIFEKHLKNTLSKECMYVVSA